MRRNTPIKTAIVVLLMTSALWAGEKYESRFIGYRSNGRGIYPPNCNPVTEWREWDWKKGKYEDNRGRERTGMIPDKRNPKNIVWKVPQLMYCNGGMILVDGKLYMMADRGGYGFSKEHTPDFLGGKLICMDPANGKTLWTRDLTHFDKLDSEVADQVKADLEDLVDWYPKAYSGFLEFREVAGPVLGGGPKNPNYYDKMPEGYEEKYAEAAKKFAEHWPEVPKTVEEMKKKYKKGEKIWTWNYSQLAFKRLWKSAWPKKWDTWTDMPKYGYGWCAWFGMSSFVGANMPTPVSDGENIYVMTGYNDMYCYSLDGEKKWSHWFGKAQDHHGQVLGSPIIVGDLVIGQMGYSGSPVTVRAIHKDTGKIAWTQKEAKGGMSYHVITPVPFTLPLPDGGTMDVIWLGNGNILRVEDGKILASKVGCHGNGRHVASDDDKDILVIHNGASDGGRGETYDLPERTLGLKLTATSRDEVKYDVLWQSKKEGRDKGEDRLVAHKGLVYGFTRGGFRVRELESGKKVAELNRVSVKPTHFSVIAGDHLFGLDEHGDCIVIKIGREPKVVATNKLGKLGVVKYPFWNQGSQPFFSGNRIFIRSYTDVFCIGDPEAEMKLSEVHKP
ncbi:MAG: PQQ-binding-like beta-propeller repeat protein [Phycisphaerae bacterium]